MYEDVKISETLWRFFGVKLNDAIKISDKYFKCCHVAKAVNVSDDINKIGPTLEYETIKLAPIKVDDYLMFWAGKCSKCGKVYVRV